MEQSLLNKKVLTSLFVEKLRLILQPCEKQPHLEGLYSGAWCLGFISCADKLIQIAWIIFGECEFDNTASFILTF